MPKHIAQILGTDEQKTVTAIARLEELSGFASEDNRLISEIKANLRMKVAQLGLDPYDTTPKELYHCLLSHFERDSGHFDTVINGISKNTNKSAANLVHLIQVADVPRDVWAVKRSVAKDLLRSYPPKKLMRRLGYRSVESMIKREDVDKLYAALPYTESPAWLKSFYKKFATVSPRDFEIRQAQLVVMAGDHWPDGKQTVSSVRVVGVIAFWSSSTASVSLRLGSFLAALTALESLRFHSYSLMAKQVRPDFGRELVKQLEFGDSPIADVGGLPIGWRSLHHYYGQLPSQLHPALGEPYLDSVATHKQSPFKTLATLNPIFRWWESSQYLSAVANGLPLSLNLADTVQNHVNGGIFSKRTDHHLRNALWDELIARYMRHPGVERYILNQVDNNPDSHKTINSAFMPKLQKEFQIA